MDESEITNCNVTLIRLIKTYFNADQCLQNISFRVTLFTCTPRYRLATWGKSDENIVNIRRL